MTGEELRAPREEMGYIFEDLIRWFKEVPNEEAGDHFTPARPPRLPTDPRHLCFGQRLR
jgi:hypothetical protein